MTTVDVEIVPAHAGAPLPEADRPTVGVDRLHGSGGPRRSLFGCGHLDGRKCTALERTAQLGRLRAQSRGHR
jgi:hypothetical protein